MQTEVDLYPKRHSTCGQLDLIKVREKIGELLLCGNSLVSRQIQTGHFVMALEGYLLGLADSEIAS